MSCNVCEPYGQLGFLHIDVACRSRSNSAPQRIDKLNVNYLKAHRLLSIFMLSISASATAQSFSYQDASSPLGAVGMLKATSHLAHFMKKKCAERIPSIAVELDANLSTWRDREAKNLAKVDALWPSMVAQEPRFEQVVSMQESVVENMLSYAAKLPDSLGEQYYTDICRRHFATLASGVWRQRTPLMYQYLDEMSETPTLGRL